VNFVIPMAGKGSRFAEAGYTVPKPLLEAHGKTLLEWSVDSLPLGLSEHLIFVGLAEHQRSIESLIARRYESYKPEFIWINEVTRGQAETVLKASPYWNEDGALLIYNIDTAFYSSGLTSALKRSDVDGILGAFRSNESRFSYAECDDDGNVKKVVEKEVISEFALTGLYHFKRTRDFIWAAEQALSKNEVVKGEYYVAPLYEKLIKNGSLFALDVSDRIAILGTPAEYLAFRETDSPLSN